MNFDRMNNFDRRGGESIIELYEFIKSLEELNESTLMMISTCEQNGYYHLCDCDSSKEMWEKNILSTYKMSLLLLKYYNEEHEEVKEQLLRTLRVCIQMKYLGVDEDEVKACLYYLKELYINHVLEVLQEDEKQMNEFVNLINYFRVTDNLKEEDNHMRKELLKAIDENLIFVYGTLMIEERNHRYLKDCVFVGEAIMEGYELLELSGYPGMVKNKQGKVRGEVYAIDEEIKSQLDILEGSQYQYSEGFVKVKGYEVFVHFYEYINKNNVTRHSITDQYKWVSERNYENLVWYVCYGSNLLKNRFDIYINDTKSRQPELMSKPISIPYELYFGNISRKWNDKGVAFLDTNTHGKTLGRAYLIHKEQLNDIQIKEGTIWYDDLYELGEDENGISYVTLSHHNRYTENSPSKEYLEVIAAGLKETYDLDMECIENNLKVSDLDISKQHIEKILENK